MQIKCEYCGAFINDTDKFCTQCGAVNDHLKRDTDGTPRTIEELKKWYEDRNLPPQETTRFFIGVDYKEPRAFGIYKSGDDFIVYKNKDDGSRAVRYQGSDEAYAVNELYLKLKSEILNQKAHNINRGGAANASPVVTMKSKVFGWLWIAIVIAMCLAFVISFISGIVGTIRDIPYADKYYRYDDDVYYCNSYVDNDWYVYDDYNRDYVPVYIPDEMYDNIEEYRFDNDEEWDSSIEVFEDTSMGQIVTSHESDSDSSYDWSSSDSWDSSDSDWGSDW